MDVFGTIIVMLSVVWIVIFGGMNSGADVEDSLTLTELKALFSRVVFTIYFSIFNMVIVALLSIGLYAYWAISLDDGSGQIRKNMKAKLTNMLETSRFAKFSGLSFAENEGLEAEAKDLKLRKLVAMIMATAGGLIASQTLLLAKSGIKLITSTLNGQNQFRDMLSFFILFVLVFTAVLQVYCLNTALKLYDSVMVVPMFYGYYTAFGLINSTIYLNQLQRYPPWALFLILIGIGALIYGVRMLSAPKPGQEGTLCNISAGAEYNDDDGEDGDGSRAFGRQAKDKMSRSGSLEKALDGTNGGDVGDAGDYVVIRKTSLIEEDEMKVDGEGKGIDTNLTLQRADAEYRDVESGMAGSVVYANMAQALESERHPTHVRRGSLPHTVLKVFGLHDRRSSVDRRSSDISPSERKRGSLPKIDTSFITRGRPETRRDPATARITSTGSRPMSPSEFRAQYTNSPLPLKPKHLQDGAPGFGTRSSSPAPVPGDDNGGRGRSPRWMIGSTKIDQVFEDLNLFKVMRRSSVDFTSTIGLPPSPNQAYHCGSHTRRDSWTGLPSTWDEPNRRVKHSMLFGENGSRGPSRSSSPVRSRRHSTHEGISRVWEANAAAMGHASNRNSNLLDGGEQSPREPQSYQNHFFTGTPPPTSATPGAGNVSTCSMNIPVSHHRTPSYTSSVAHGHGRQLSYTTKSDQGLSALLTHNTSSSALAAGSNIFSTSTGTFGDFTPSAPSSASASGHNALPLSVQQQLQQLQQHQHHPTSHLQHSITTSSISTIGSVMPSLSSTSLAQLVMDDNIVDMSAPNSGDKASRHGQLPESTSSASLWMKMTPSQLMQAVELDLDELDRQVRERKSSELKRSDDI
ncbi:hypothetical protein BGX27_003240 [Mortierella sp. AM989]|nr:hypothetical protein BGX27_003240 [Mortierella sp. AM989]